MIGALAGDIIGSVYTGDHITVSLGGDADTLVCITGGIAQAFYGVPEPIQKHVYEMFDERLGGITRAFMEQYC